MKNKITAFLRRAALAVLAVGIFMPLLGAPVSAAVSRQSIAVPMYQYPTLGTFWDDITSKGAANVPFVIVNPATGPGVTVDPIYTAEIAENTADGIRSLGYVHSMYQTRDWQEVYDDIDDWYVMYPGISGIIIDLVADGTAEDLCYVATLYNHIKNEHPNDLVVLNPGTNISQDYEPYGDIFMNAENTYAQYQANWQIMYPGWEDNPAYQDRFWHAIHTTSPANYAAALALTRANNAGWVYITDDVMPVPYQVEPAYWDTEVDDVNDLPPANIPNRGKTQLPTGCVDLTATAGTPTSQVLGESTKTSASIQLANSSATYVAEPATRLAFTLPQNVQFAGTGTGWSCTTAGNCTYATSIPKSGNAAVLSAAFTAACGYGGGTVQGTATNFAGNASLVSVTLPVSPPCSLAGQLANTGIPGGVLSGIAALFMASAIGVYIARAKIKARPARQARW